MISYEPLWATMKQKEITKYQLTYHWGISSNTLRRIGHSEPIISNTLNDLCLILDCQVQDVLRFEPTEEELELFLNCICNPFNHFKINYNFPKSSDYRKVP